MEQRPIFLNEKEIELILTSLKNYQLKNFPTSALQAQKLTWELDLKEQLIKKLENK